MKQLISLTDYQRIFETIHSALKYFDINPVRNCTYFSIIGAALLDEHFGIECKFYSGAAAYFLDHEKEIVLGCGEQIDPNNFIGSMSSFHSWNENADYVIDFQAPLFPEIMRELFGEIFCERKMFQRPILERCYSPTQFQKSGDFFHLPDLDLTKHVADLFAEEPSNLDLLSICNRWFVNPISDMQPTYKIRMSSGQYDSLLLHKTQLNGQW